MILTSLLYKGETWMLYKQHFQQLDMVHQCFLCFLLRITWFELVSNAKVLQSKC